MNFVICTGKALTNDVRRYDRSQNSDFRNHWPHPHSHKRFYLAFSLTAFLLRTPFPRNHVSCDIFTVSKAMFTYLAGLRSQNETVCFFLEGNLTYFSVLICQQVLWVNCSLFLPDTCLWTGLYFSGTHRILDLQKPRVIKLLRIIF